MPPAQDGDRSRGNHNLESSGDKQSLSRHRKSTYLDMGDGMRSKCRRFQVSCEAHSRRNPLPVHQSSNVLCAVAHRIHRARQVQRQHYHPEENVNLRVSCVPISAILFLYGVLLEAGHGKLDSAFAYHLQGAAEVEWYTLRTRRITN